MPGVTCSATQIQVQFLTAELSRTQVWRGALKTAVGVGCQGGVGEVAPALRRRWAEGQRWA